MILWFFKISSMVCNPGTLPVELENIKPPCKDSQPVKGKRVKTPKPKSISLQETPSMITPARISGNESVSCSQSAKTEKRWVFRHCSCVLGRLQMDKEMLSILHRMMWCLCYLQTATDSAFVNGWVAGNQSFQSPVWQGEHNLISARGIDDK